MSTANKPNSFSFITEPLDPKRFLGDLPMRPEVAEGESATTTTPFSTNSILLPTSTLMDPSRTVATLDGRDHSMVTPSTTASAFSPGGVNPTSSSMSSPNSKDSTRSQRSKSKNRLSTTLTGLLGKGRSRSASKGAESDRNPDLNLIGRPSTEERESTGGRRMSTSSSRRTSIDATAVSASPSPSPSPPLGSNAVTSETPSSRSKPPVSLPSLFRRRPSSSSITTTSRTNSNGTPSISLDQSRRSFDRPPNSTMNGLELSSSSLGSSDGGLISDVSTAATSPDLETAEVTTPRARNEPFSSAEKRRRSSVVLAQELDGRTDGEEDLSDFVRASGSTSPSPSLSSGPFARRASSSTSFSPPFAALPEASPVSPISSSTTPLAPEPTAEGGIAARRQTRNIENLNLGDLGRSRSPVPASSTDNESSTTAPPPLAPLSLPSSADPSTRPRSTTQARLQALPRLLSMDAIPSYGPAHEEDEQEPDEETESEAEEGEVEGETEGETTADATSDDEGEHYASADEAPVVSRNTTPAQTPRPTSRQTSFERFASTSSSSSSRASGPPRIPSLTGLSSPSFTGGRPAASWVTFAPPTPGTVKTARPQPSSTESANQSYFDLPRPSTSTSRTPGVPPQTPLAPMSISDVARGKRPALQEQVDQTMNEAANHPRTASTPGLAQSTEPEDVSATARHGLYRLRSQSEVALMSPSMVDSDDEPLGTAAITGLDSIWRTGGVETPGPSFLTKPATPIKTKTSPAPLPSIEIPGSPATPKAAATPSSPKSTSPTQARLSIARPGTANNRLHRPRSMYELRDAPPAYTSIARQPGFGPRQDVEPREEEGKEGLPQYTCSIHIEGFMPRKMEFTSPGVQAKDRAWKRQYIVLHGTSIKVYKYDLRTHPIPGEEDWSVVPVDIAGKDGPPPLHFHQGEYGVDNSSQGIRFPLSIEDAKAKAKSRIIQQATASSTNLLLRHYSLQNAESGLAADYIKRKHVVRVRAEGEQFLLQAKDDRGVIDLIEALQAATNVALDLDARPLPKFITLPRRRRRRRPRPDANAATPATAASSTTERTASSASTADRAPAAPERTRRSPDRFAEMADEDRALASGNDATLM
ncbi:uncharacterized protein JCM6883_001940 [Sporobolomyces salmoneus]|uniref:uncharacterized protein n=1 Tax=Sporobolomyces salmoneus TaxID=183962 RepID=UPI0031813F69